MSGTPVSHKKRHHSKSRVSHHTVHLSVMDGTVRMTASQSQTSSNWIHLSGALCSILKIKTASACKSLKRQTVAGRKSALIAQRQSFTALPLTFRSFHSEAWGSAMRPLFLRQGPLHCPSFTSILSGFPSSVPTSRRSRGPGKNLAARPLGVRSAADVTRCDLCLYR